MRTRITFGMALDGAKWTAKNAALGEGMACGTGGAGETGEGMTSGTGRTCGTSEGMTCGTGENCVTGEGMACVTGEADETGACSARHAGLAGHHHFPKEGVNR